MILLNRKIHKKTNTNMTNTNIKNAITTNTNATNSNATNTNSNATEVNTSTIKNKALDEITNGKIGRQLLKYFFPILIGSFLQQLYSTVDAAIVGTYVGEEALAAIGGTTSTLINLMVNFFVGLSTGATVLISQYYGSRNSKLLHRGIQTAYLMGIGGGILLMGTGFLLAPLGLRLIGTPDTVMVYALTFIRIYLLGMVSTSIYNVGFGILRAVGDFKRPLYFLSAACILNLILDIIFVAIYKWGVAGAATATVISQTFSAVLISVYLFTTKKDYKIPLKQIDLSFPILGKMIRVGFPAGMQAMMYGISNIIIQAGINTFDTDYIAALTAYDKLDGFYWMMMSAFGVSITTFVGQNFGAGKYQRIKESVKKSILMVGGCCIGFNMLAILFGRVFFGFFTNDVSIIDIGVHMVNFLMPMYFTYVCIEVLSGTIRGVGNTIIPMIITCVGVCVLRVAWVLIMMPIWHSIYVLMFSYPLSWAVTSLIFILYFRYGNWMERAVKK